MPRLWKLTTVVLLSLIGAVGCTESPPASSSAAGSAGKGEPRLPTDQTRTEMNEPPQYNELTDLEKYVILQKGTEGPYVGKYTDLDEPGTYICRRCNAPLYRSDDKFHSNCGWPAFDDEIQGAVERHLDADGARVEIVCHNCDGHLGHVFEGEQFTEKNVRHCVNSVSMTFVPEGNELPEVVGKRDGSHD